MLQDVVFADGRVAVGSFGYDDVTNEVTSWNIRVDGAPGILPFTYVPGDSAPWAGLIAEGLPGQHFRYIFYANQASGGAERLPTSLGEANQLLAKSKAARALFGPEFVDHYVRTRDFEVRCFERAVTNFELARYFEVI